MAMTYHYGSKKISTQPSKQSWEDRANRLLEDHWKYHAILLNVVCIEAQEELKAWYKAVGFHFYKHAIEDIRALKDDLV